MGMGTAEGRKEMLTSEDRGYLCHLFCTVGEIWIINNGAEFEWIFCMDCEIFRCEYVRKDRGQFLIPNFNS